MRVVQLAGYAAPYGGSFASMLAGLAAQAAQRGWRPEVVLPDEAAERPWIADLERAGTPPRFMSAPDRRALGRQIAELLGEHDGPTLLHTHFTDYDVPATLAARGREKTVVVWHLHSRLTPGPLAWARNSIKFRTSARRVARILCVAENIADAALGRGAPPERTEIWPNAIDVDRFTPGAPDARRGAREALGLPPDAEVVVHFGWDWERKGGDLYLAAMERLAAERPGLAAATVAGEDGVPVADTGRVSVLAPQERVQTLYEAADVFVSCSRAEGMPFSMAEALASGVGVVATDIPGQVAIGEGVEACRLIPGEPQRIAAATGELLEREPAEVARQGTAAREHVRASMGVEGWAARTADLYERLMRAEGPRS